MRKTLTRCATLCTLAILYLLLPLMPLLASLLFMRWKFVRHYSQSLQKALIHIAAINEGPLQHYFTDVAGRARQIPDEIQGSCVQCGIYSSFWRRFSNCSSFPLNQYDIERYACPSYFAVSKRISNSTAVSEIELRPVPVRFVRNVADIHLREKLHSSDR